MQYFALSFLDIIYWLPPVVIIDFTSLISAFTASLTVYGDIKFFESIVTLSISMIL